MVLKQRWPLASFHLQILQCWIQAQGIPQCWIQAQGIPQCWIQAQGIPQCWEYRLKESLNVEYKLKESLNVEYRLKESLKSCHSEIHFLLLHWMAAPLVFWSNYITSQHIWMHHRNGNVWEFYDPFSPHPTEEVHMCWPSTANAGPESLDCF